MGRDNLKVVDSLKIIDFQNTFLLLDPDSQIVCAVVVVQEIECTVVFRIDKLTLVPILGVRDVQN